MNKSANKKIITFYEVPLVCGAAPAIGCGSRAKPLLMDLERKAEIEEAWLNRAGTIVAIVWSGSAHTAKIAKPVFERHGCYTGSGATTGRLLSRKAGFAAPKSIT